MCKSGLMMWFVAFPVLALACMASGFNLREASVTDCGGADATILFVQGTLSPDPIQYPGTVNLGVEFEVYENLPEGLQIELQLTKLDPDMEVPCLGGLGSCTYDVCDLVTDYADIFCQLFPPGGCVCPIPQGTYASDSLPFELPDFGDIFATLLQGSYTGKIIFHTLADPNTIYGCLDLTFEIVKA